MSGTPVFVLAGVLALPVSTPAGQPLGDDAGFVPPDRSTLACETRVSKALSKDAACLDRCTLRAARAAFFRGQPFDDEACEAACGTALVGTAERLFANGTCPPCITRFSPAVVAMANEASSNAAVGLVACAGTIPLGGDDTGFVAPEPIAGRCELAVGKHVSALDQAMLRCHRRLAAAAFGGRPFDEEACEDAAQRRYEARNARLTGCPPCLDSSAIGDLIRASADANNGLIFCASPSGAFLDQQP